MKLISSPVCSFKTLEKSIKTCDVKILSLHDEFESLEGLSPRNEVHLYIHFNIHFSS